MGARRGRYEVIPIVDAARRCGVVLNDNTLGRREVEAVCPFCGDKPRRYHLNLNTEKDQYKCMLCEASGNSVSLYARLQNVSYADAARDLLGDSNVYQFPRPPRPKTPPEREPKPISGRHDVYFEMLSHLTLSEKHLDDLRKRGLSDERIARNMYRTLPDSESARRILAGILADFYDLLGVPGFYTEQRDTAPNVRAAGKNGCRAAPTWTLAGNGGLLIPVCDKDGYIQGMQVRLDDEAIESGLKARRYRWLSSRYKENGTKSSTWIHVTGDITSKTAFLTEGPLKGDVASFHDNDALFICVAGVNSIVGLTDVVRSLGVSEILIAADMDRVTSEQVRKGFDNITAALSGIRGLRVRPIDWNVGIKGIDDFYLLRRKAYERGQNMSISENYVTRYVQTLWQKEYPKQDSGWIGSCEWEETVRPIGALSFQAPKNMKKAEEYKAKVDAGVVFPPVVVINGVVIDGLHRCWAYAQAGQQNVHVYQNKPFVLQEVA